MQGVYSVQQRVGCFVCVLQRVSVAAAVAAPPPRLLSARYVRYTAALSVAHKSLYDLSLKTDFTIKTLKRCLHSAPIVRTREYATRILDFFADSRLPYERVLLCCTFLFLNAPATSRSVASRKPVGALSIYIHVARKAELAQLLSRYNFY